MAQQPADHMPTPTLLLGVDLVRIDDVAETIARFGDRYAGRVFTSDEQAYCLANQWRVAEHFAARFAAKEATLKVLRPSESDGVAWQSIEVRRLESGACAIVLHGAARALAHRRGVVELTLSMSHDRAYATATVIARVANPDGDSQPANDRGALPRHRHAGGE